MIGVQRFAAVAAFAVPILTGTPAEAQPQSVRDLAQELSLPVGKPAYYYNRATNTVIIEKCDGSGSQYSCKMRILGQTALISSVQSVEYRQNGDGNLNISASVPRQSQKWGERDTDSYRTRSGEAEIRSLPEGSPLAEAANNTLRSLLQNNVGRISKRGDGVSVDSVMPVSANRAFNIRMTFNQDGGAVTLSAVPKAVWGNTVVTPPASLDVSRDFDHTTDDVRYYNDYGAQARNGPLYFIRTP